MHKKIHTQKTDWYKKLKLFLFKFYVEIKRKEKKTKSVRFKLQLKKEHANWLFIFFIFGGFFVISVLEIFDAVATQNKYELFSIHCYLMSKKLEDLETVLKSWNTWNTPTYTIKNIIYYLHKPDAQELSLEPRVNNVLLKCKD